LTPDSERHFQEHQARWNTPFMKEASAVSDVGVDPTRNAFLTNPMQN
jgi:hypothetical protein